MSENVSEKMQQKFGYFGKTIHSAEMLEYNLPRLFVDVWRDWLDSVLLESEYDIADKWSVIYREASRYYFSISVGIAGTAGWIGLVAPSTDAFGRRYPFCLAMPVPDTTPPFSALIKYDRVLRAANTLIGDLMNEDFDIESLNDQVDALAATIGDVDGSYRVNRGVPCADDSISVCTDGSVFKNPEATTAVLDALLIEMYGQYSVWTISAESVEETTFFVSGMPGAKQGVALFDHQWVNRGFTVVSDASNCTEQL